MESYQTFCRKSRSVKNSEAGASGSSKRALQEEGCQIPPYSPLSSKRIRAHAIKGHRIASLAHAQDRTQGPWSMARSAFARGMDQSKLRAFLSIKGGSSISLPSPLQFILFFHEEPPPSLPLAPVCTSAMNTVVQSFPLCILTTIFS